MSQTEGAPAAPPGQWVEVRPEPGLAQGQYAWPAWAIVVLGSAIVLAGSAYLLVRWRNARASR